METGQCGLRGMNAIENAEVGFKLGLDLAPIHNLLSVALTVMENRWTEGHATPRNAQVQSYRCWLHFNN